MIVKLYDEKITVDTDWTYDQTVENLKKQGVQVTITGGSWILTHYKFRRGGIQSFFDWLAFAQYVYFYELDFTKRKNNAKMIKIGKHWRRSFEDKHGMMEDQLIWSAPEQ